MSAPTRIALGKEKHVLAAGNEGPSKKLWFDAKDLTPPLPGSWRTEGRKKDYPGLFALARWPVRRGDLIVSEVRSRPVANFELAIRNRR